MFTPTGTIYVYPATGFYAGRFTKAAIAAGIPKRLGVVRPKPVRRPKKTT